MEYVKTVSRPFDGDLLEAWKALDADQSGGLDEQEWCSASDKFHYHGPAKEVFQFLDKDGEGVVTLDKFLALKDTSHSTFHRRRAVQKNSVEELFASNKHKVVFEDQPSPKQVKALEKQLEVPSEIQHLLKANSVVSRRASTLLALT